MVLFTHALPVFLLALTTLCWEEIHLVSAAVSSITTRLHNCVGSPQHLDIDCAIGSALDMSPEEINSPIFGNRPILHHVMNLCMISKDPSISARLIELAMVLVDRGANTNDPFSNDPDVVTKALIIRELDLAHYFAEKGGAQLNELLQLQTLISISCNPTPTAKMLLHADTILRSSKENSEWSRSAEELLAGATLQSSTRSLSSRHLAKYSEQYRTMLTQLGGTTEDNMHLSKVELSGILGSAGDIMSAIFKQLIRNHVATTTSLTPTQRLLASLLSSVIDNSGRNLMHLLALSGSTAVIRDIQVIFDEAPNDVLEPLVEALRARDARGLTPVAAAAVRFGNSNHFHALFNLSIQCKALPPLATTSIFDPYLKVHTPIESSSSAAGPKISSLDGRRDGGWSSQRLQPSLAGDGRCDITEVFEVPKDPREFFEQYVIAGKPVVFRGAATQHSQYVAFVKSFEKHMFLEKYGADAINIAEIPYAGSFGVSGVTVNLTQVANMELSSHVEIAPDGDAVLPEVHPSGSAPLYAFTTAVRSAIKSEALPPLFINGLAKDIELQFYLGPAGSGAPPHFHGHAVNSLAFGEKRWFLYSPRDAFYSATPAIDFAKLITDKDRVKADNLILANILECTQYAGDFIYVPTLWGHATLNVKQSIGVAHEFSVEPICME